MGYPALPEAIEAVKHIQHRLRDMAITPPFCDHPDHVRALREAADSLEKVTGPARPGQM